MPDSPLTAPNAASRSLDSYLNCLIMASKSQNKRHWYVKFIEESINAQFILNLKRRLGVK